MESSLHFSDEFWKWVEENKSSNVSRLLLSASPKLCFDTNRAILQIECRQRFGKKIESTLSAFPRFYFPSLLSGEQCTGDLFANFHQSLIKDSDTLTDLTSGLGIDVIHFASKCKEVIAVERNDELTAALRYNAKGLGITKLKVIEGDCRELVDKLSTTVAFIDPARRAADGSRVYGLADCEPNILEMLPAIKKNFERLIIKASPMLDISQTLLDIPGITDVYSIGSTTECKELVFVVDLKREQISEPTIHAVTLKADGNNIDFSFTPTQEKEATATIRPEGLHQGDFLYEPYPATMKALPAKLLAEKFGLIKFHTNTHLYYSEGGKIVNDFPGDIFEVVDVIGWQSKNLKKFSRTYPNVTVSVRNFGMTAEALRSKLGVKEGGADRLRLFGIGLGKDHTERLLVVAKEKTVAK